MATDPIPWDQFQANKAIHTFCRVRFDPATSEVIECVGMHCSAKRGNIPAGAVTTLCMRRYGAAPVRTLMTFDSVDRALEADVRAAKQKLVEVAAERDYWTAFELKKRARNGWGSSTMGLALYALLDEGTLARASDQRVYVPQI